MVLEWTIDGCRVDHEIVVERTIDGCRVDHRWL